jgi:hypothetical protein
VLGEEHFSPAFRNIPTNAVIRTIGLGNPPSPREIYENGVLRTDVVNDVVQHGARFVLTQFTEEPFALGAVVEIRETEDVPWISPQRPPTLTLEVVTEADLDPPTWDGSYKVDHKRMILPAPLAPCGAFRSHTFEWEGMADDVWDPSELLLIAVPHDLDHAEFVSDGIGETIGDGACSDDDPTLKSDFHRSYDVFVEDGSGNRIGPFEIDTRACGCAGPPAPFGGQGLLVSISLGAYCLRRSRIHARRPPSSPLPPRLLEG